MEAEHQHDAFYRDLVEGSTQGIFVVCNGRVVFANAAFVEMMGYGSANEILGLADATVLVAPEDRKRIMDYASARQVGGEAPDRYEMRALRADGEVVPQEVIARPTRWDGVPALQISVIDITERKQAEESLRESEARFRDLIEGSIQGILVHRDFRLLFANRAMAEILGYESPKTLLELDSLLDFLDPGEHARATDIKNARLAGKDVPERFELHAVRRDGSTVWLENIARVVNWDGECAIQATVIDITERKQAEEALRRSEEGLMNAQRIAGMGSFEHDFAAGRLTWSSQVYSIFGIDAEAGPPDHETFMRMVHPEDREVVAEMAASMTQNIGSCHVDYRIIRPDDKLRWLHMEAETVGDETGNAAAMAGIVQDMTDFRRTEQALRHSEESLRQAQRIARIGNWELDLTKDELYWSDEMYRLFGLEPDAVAPSYDLFMSYVHPEDRQALRDTIRRALAGEASYDMDVRVLQPDGVEIVIHAQGEIDRDSGGRPVFFRGTAQDVTKLREAEAEVRRLNEKLEERVEQRTRELREAQAELIKKERLATLGQLTATVSHELRNPLGAMRASAYLLAKSLLPENEGALRAASRIERGIVRCDRIIDELLDFTRSTTIDREPVTIDRWLADVLSEQSIPEGIVVDTDLRLTGLTVTMDPGRMRRAVINVVENACQAITGQPGWDEGGNKGRISVSTARADGKIEIRIADNGPGLPADLREKIFQPLFSTKNFGVGLGLPTVLQILEQHGGRVALESGTGAGTVFRLIFPLIKAGHCRPASTGDVVPADIAED